jgi:hypothetical protein
MDGSVDMRFACCNFLGLPLSKIMIELLVECMRNDVPNNHQQSRPKKAVPGEDVLWLVMLSPA